MINKKHESTTRGIKNCRDIGLFKGCSPLQLLCSLIGNRPQSATFHTANRCTQAKKRHSSNMIEDLKREKMENANPQKQEFGSPSLQPSLRCQTHAFFPTHAD